MNDTPEPSPLVRRLGRVEYLPTWEAMQRFTAGRDTTTPDEIWLLEHPSVYTLGLNAQHGEFPNPDAIPVIQTDRGGDITYHGPGQIVAYVLMDLRRRNWGVRHLVDALEQTVVDLLAGYGVTGERRPKAPGVYVAGRKIAQLGLRVRGGASYHGLSFNAAMDLGPFGRIRPCGYQDLETVDLASLDVTAGTNRDLAAVGDRLLALLLGNLGYNAGQPVPGPDHPNGR